MTASSEPSGEIDVVAKLATRTLWLFLAYAVFGAAWFGHAGWLVAGLAFIVGAIAFGLMLLSWRHYHYWASWAIWLVPTTLFAALLIKLLVLPSVAAGALSPLASISALFGFGGVGFMAPAFFLRRRLVQWFSRH
jgi:hypothetical protein